MYLVLVLKLVWVLFSPFSIIIYMYKWVLFSLVLLFIYFYAFIGAAMAQYAGKHLHEYITKRSEYKEGDVIVGVQQGFLELDEAMQNNAALRDEHAGTTVIAILIKDNILYSVSHQSHPCTLTSDSLTIRKAL